VVECSGFQTSRCPKFRRLLESTFWMSGATRLFRLETLAAVATLTSAASAISLSPTWSLFYFDPSCHL
jgi:hypothetical protein